MKGNPINFGSLIFSVPRECLRLYKPVSDWLEMLAH